MWEMNGVGEVVRTEKKVYILLFLRIDTGH